MQIDQERVQFIRGILVSLASCGQTITYEELRRLSRLSMEMVGTYLGEARSVLRSDEPDFCAVVIGRDGQPGHGFGHLTADTFLAEQQRVFRYWKERRALDNEPFAKKYGDRPSIP